MSFDISESYAPPADKKRRMSLKGPPLRVIKQAAPPAAAPPAPTPTVSAPKPRPSLAGPSMSERRMSISARSQAKAPAAKPVAAQSVVHAPAVVQQAPVDPLAKVNARLDTIERQISDIQSVLSKFSALEDLMRPLKVTITTLEGDVAELSSTVKRLTEKPTGASKIIAEHPFNVQMGDSEQPEFVEEVINELDQSLDSGEIDLAEYGHSLRYVLGKESRIVGAVPMMSTPVAPKRSTSQSSFQAQASFEQPMDTPSKFNQPISTYTAAPSSRPRVQYDRTPIKRHVSTSAAVPSFTRSTTATPIAPSRATVEVHTPEKEEENLKNLKLSSTAHGSRPSGSSPVSCVAEVAKIQMEPISVEEKANVSFWLGFDFNDLTRAITLINDLALTRQSGPGFDSSTCKEIVVTLEEVADQVLLEPKRANAMILLLCNLKRLRLIRRGDTKAYLLLTGNTIKA